MELSEGRFLNRADIMIWRMLVSVENCDLSHPVPPGDGGLRVTSHERYEKKREGTAMTPP